MEKRTAKPLVNKDGKGYDNFRLLIPTKWAKQLGISRDDRELDIKFDGETIYITKKESDK